MRILKRAASVLGLSELLLAVFLPLVVPLRPSAAPADPPAGDGSRGLLLASTFLGGAGDEIDFGPFIEVAPDGTVYLSGFTSGNGFPVTSGACQTVYGGGTLDGFVARLSNDLSTLLAATYVGGNRMETECTLTLAPDGTVYIGAYTSSIDLPTTPDAYDRTPNGMSDIYLARYSADLSQLLAATYLGGSQSDGYYNNRIGLRVDGAGDLVCLAQSASPDFPVTAGAYDTSFNGVGPVGSGDFVVAKLDPQLTTVKAATFFGGSSDEWNATLTLVAGDDVVISGATLSANLPWTSGAFDQTYNGGIDVVLARFSSDLSTLQAATYYGRAGDDEPFVTATDLFGSVLIAGSTTSPSLPLTYGNHGGGDGFIARFDATLHTLQTARLLGGAADDRVQALTVGSFGEVIVVGKTLSTDFPVAPTIYDDTYNGGSEHGDFFVSAFDFGLSTLLGSTYLGGAADEKPFGIDLDPAGNIFVGGFTHSGGFPTTPGAFDTSFGGLRDVVVAKLSLQGATAVPVAATSRLSGIRVCPNPCNPRAVIAFTIGDAAGSACRVRLELCDLRGRVVRTLLDETRAPGRHSATWDGRDERGRPLPSGVYRWRLQGAGEVYTGKLTLVK